MGGVFSNLFGQSNEDRLFKACQNNDVETVASVLQKFAPGGGGPQLALKLDSMYDSNGRNPLMAAAIFGSVEVVRYLASCGVSLDARQQPSSSSPLHLAAAAGKRDVCLALLDLGADATALNAYGFTAIDVARKLDQTHVLRALERRTALFWGWMKWERSSLFQAGLGKMLGASVKEALQKKFGGEWRECWVVVTKLIGKISNTMKCPRCSAQFSDPRDAGTRIHCPRCSAELHIPQTATISVLELAIYGSPNDSKPQICFPLNVASVESEFNVRELGLRAVKLFLQRPAVAANRLSARSDGVVLHHGHGDNNAATTYGIVEGSGKTVLWGQSTLTMKAAESNGTKKVVFAVEDHIPGRQNLSRFIAALKANPVNAIAFAKATEGNVSAPTFGEGTVTINVDGAIPINVHNIREFTDTRPWTCGVCTLENEGSAFNCAACEAPRTSAARYPQSQQSRISSATAPPPTSNLSGASIVPPPPLESDRLGVMLLSEDAEDYDDVPIAGEVPAHFICPLTGEIMNDPVVVSDGTSFERSAIERHFRQRGAVSPVTMLPLSSTSVVPNLALRTSIEQWRTQFPVASVAEFESYNQVTMT